MEVERSYAKINLTLDVLGKRDDGYHDMDMVMESVDLWDEISIDFQGDSMRVRSNLPYLPSGEKNLAWKAAKAFYHRLGEPMPSMEMTIEKKIPVCAGLAGGSGNAAAVLRILQRVHGSPFAMEEIQAIGKSIGADVPYCLVGGSQRAEGIGERLTSLSPMPSCYLLLCKPNFPISTPELFQRMDSTKIKHRPDTLGMIEAISSGDVQGVACRMFNVFEEFLQPRHGNIIHEIKNTMIDSGALGSSMSGSGPTVIGLFSEKEKAEACGERLALEYRETYLTEPMQ